MNIGFFNITRKYVSYRKTPGYNDNPFQGWGPIVKILYGGNIKNKYRLVEYSQHHL